MFKPALTSLSLRAGPRTAISKSATLNKFITQNFYHYRQFTTMAELNIEIPKLKLNDGVEIPMLGFGTGSAMYKGGGDKKSVDKERVQQILTAIKTGYRHLDGAEVYNTEKELGAAIKESKLPRSEFFVTSKVVSMQNVQGALDQSLKDLGLDYVDLYLIHEPFFAEGDETKLQATWAELEKAKEAGKVRSIGVSNFNQSQIESVLKTAKVVPSINQTEFSPYFQRKGLKPYLESKGIALSAFGPLTPVLSAGKPGPLDPLLAQLAKKYAVNEGEILLRWAVDNNVVPITTSSNEQRLSDMLRIATFKLTPREVDELTKTGLEKEVRRFWPNKTIVDED